MSGSAMPNTASLANAGTLGNTRGSGSMLPSGTTAPIRNCISASPLARRQDAPGRAPAVELLEAVLEDDPCGSEAVGDLLEVDDDVVALGDRDAEARGLDRPPEQVAVVGD